MTDDGNGMYQVKYHVRNCEMKDGHGGVVVGSEISGGYRTCC